MMDPLTRSSSQYSRFMVIGCDCGLASLRRHEMKNKKLKINRKGTNTTHGCDVNSAREDSFNKSQAA